jgi:hypothetical protein
MKHSGRAKSPGKKRENLDSGGRFASRAETIFEACQQQV